MASISDFIPGRSVAARCSMTVTPKCLARPRSCSSSRSAGILSITFASPPSLRLNVCWPALRTSSATEIEMMPPLFCASK